MNVNNLMAELERKHPGESEYLQAVREVFTKRDNLPDYRTPQDQGFTGYNRSWKTPDFAEFCKKNLK